MGRKAEKVRPRVLIQCFHTKSDFIYVVNKYSMMEISEKKAVKLFEEWQHTLSKKLLKETVLKNGIV